MGMIDRRRNKLWLFASAALLATTPAFAQEAAPEGGLETVVVTAQKREQAAIDVPLSLTTYTGRNLQALGVQQFDQLSLYVPGFTVQNQSPNNPAMAIRGITSDSGEASVEPRVSIYQDGVSISKSRGSFVELFDNERIEVAKGPQSTLFGRGALIGAVNVVQAKADPHAPDWMVRLDGGSYDYRLVEAMANVPVGDTFAIRFAGRAKARDGYVSNALDGGDFNSLSTAAARVALAWRPVAGVTADVLVNYEEDHPSGTSFKSRAFSPTDPTTGRVLAGREAWEPAALAPGAGFEGGKPLGLDRYLWSATGLLGVDLGPGLRLSSISAFRRFQSTEVFDADGLSLPILTAAEDARGKQWSQELRLNYDQGGLLAGFVGVNYFKEKGSQRTPGQFDERMALADLAGQLNAGAAGLGLAASNPAPSAIFGATPFTGALLQGAAAALSGNRLILTPAVAQALAGRLRPNHIETATNGAELTSWDVFADVTLRPTDRIELSGGLRYTTDDKTTSFSSAVVGGRSVLGGVIGAAQLAAAGQTTQANALIQGLAAVGSNLAAPVPLPAFALSSQPTANNGDTVSQDLDSSGTTWRLVGRYKLSEQANLYASYSRGRRPEVLAVKPPSQPSGAPRFGVVPAETVDSYEAGAKAQLDNRLRLEGAVYYYTYDNFQTIQQQGTLFVTANAGKADSYGFEGQMAWAASPHLDLFATYAYSHARFQSGAYKGNSPRLSPDHQLSVGGAWRAEAGGGTFEVRPTLTWQSKVFFDDNNDLAAFQQTPQAFVADNVQDEVQGGYALANLRLGYSRPGANWRAEVFVTNLFDKRFIKDAGNTGDTLGLPTFIAGEPRFVGLSLTFRR